MTGSGSRLRQAIADDDGHKFDPYTIPSYDHLIITVGSGSNGNGQPPGSGTRPASGSSYTGDCGTAMPGDGTGVGDFGANGITSGGDLLLGYKKSTSHATETIAINAAKMRTIDPVGRLFFTLGLGWELLGSVGTGIIQAYIRAYRGGVLSLANFADGQHYISSGQPVYPFPFVRSSVSLGSTTAKLMMYIRLTAGQSTSVNLL